MSKRKFTRQKVSRTKTVWIAHDHYLQVHLVSQKTTCTITGSPVKHKITTTTRTYKLRVQAFEKRGKKVVRLGDLLRFKVENPKEGFPFGAMALAIGFCTDPDISEHQDELLESLEILSDRIYTAELKWSLGGTYG